MATTINNVFQKQGDAAHILQLDLSAGGADTSVTFTIPGAPQIFGVSSHNVTTGAVNVASITYVAATGVLTVPCANSDRLRIGVILQ